MSTQIVIDRKWQKQVLAAVGTYARAFVAAALALYMTGAWIYMGRMKSYAITVASSLVDNAYKRELLSMELDRLDDLQRAVWQDAINGDLKAVETALKIIQTRAKVLGLDNVQSATVTNNTIVVAGTSEEYINALRQAAQKPLMIESEQDATT